MTETNAFNRARLGGCLAIMAVLLASCSGLSREDAVDELISIGYQPESAECIIAAVEEQGYEAGDLADPVAPEVETALESAIDGCITAADAVGVSEAIGEDELRAEVITDLVSDGMESDQAECIISAVEAAGFSVVDLAAVGLEDPGAENVVEALRVATEECALG